MDADECTRALQAVRPGEAFGTPLPILGGWSFYTFAVDDLIVRFPTTGNDADAMQREFALLPELGRVLPIAIPQYTITGQWRGWPFGAYRRLPGEPLDPASTPPADAAALAAARHAAREAPRLPARPRPGTARHGAAR